MGSFSLIISGGDFCEIPDYLRSADYIIACDLGWMHAKRLGLIPDLIVGDFDSSSEPVTDIPVEKHPVMKDDTDTMLAVRRSMELGYRDIAVCCAFGGRFDHSFANIQTAAYIAGRGGRGHFYGTDTEAVVFASSREYFRKKEGWSLSVFSLSDRSEGVTISGSRYNCENICLTNSHPLGVSNDWAEERACVAVEKGTVLVLMSKL